MKTHYPRPFQNIALSLSGGGFRAASFSLGVLSYLNQLRWGNTQTLLQEVTVLSTISGGTLTGAKFALHRAATSGSSTEFSQFFREMYHFMDQSDIVAEAMALLNSESEWKNPPRPQKLITAFAEVYHRQLLNNAHFSDLWDGGALSIQNVIFNATDLEHTNLFRFQTGGDFGNGQNELFTSNARNIRIADAVAASSCFPAGFEPLIMPDDFDHSSDGALRSEWKNGKIKIRLMDGGIADNQGITSVILTEERLSRQNNDQPYIGTFLQADVATNAAPEEKKEKPFGYLGKHLKLRQINWFAGGLFILSAIAICWTGNKWVTAFSTFFLTVSGAWLLLYKLSVNFILRKLKSTVGQANPAFLKHFKILENISLQMLIDLLLVRVYSVLDLLSDVFLSRTRALNYKLLYSHPDWRYRISNAYIYSLLRTGTLDVKALGPYVQKANTMDTSLWFSDDQKRSGMLQSLIITGQATICQSLIRYIERLEKPSEEFSQDKVEMVSFLSLFSEDEDLLRNISTLKSQLLEDWEKFTTAPDWLMINLLSPLSSNPSAIPSLHRQRVVPGKNI